MAARTAASMLTAMVLPVCLIVAAGRSTQTMSPQQRETSPAAVVSGRVFDGEGELPARFVQVRLVSRTKNASIRYEALTAEDGAFVFDAVQPGTCYLGALKPTYPPAFYSPDGGTAADPGAAIQVAPGQQLRDLNVHVRKGGVIAGRVTDQQGEAVSTPVAARRLTSARPAPDPLFYFESQQSFRRDEQGNYRIYGLVPGDYFVMTDDGRTGVVPESQSGVFTRAFFPDTTDPMAAVPVSVAWGQERAGIDLTVRAVPAFSVSGTAAGPSDPAEQVGLRLITISPPLLSLPARTGLASNGRFVLDRVPPGRYWLTASVRERPPADAAPDLPAALWWTVTPIAVSDRDVTDVVLALQPSSSLSGEIVFHQPAAELRGDTNGYVVSLTAVLEAAAPPFGIPASNRSGTDGRFRVLDIPPGRYRLTVRASSGPTQIVSVTIDGRELPNMEIELMPGTNIEHVIVRIKQP